MSEQPLQDWQITIYGDSVAAKKALAYFRERGWLVDDRYAVEAVDARIYAFMSGYRVGCADAASMEPAPSLPSAAQKS